MLLLIMCGDLEVADRRMTPAITLVVAHAFVAGAPSLGRQRRGHGVRHGGPLAPRGPAACGPALGAPLLLALGLLTAGQSPALPARGGGARRALGPRGTGTGRQRAGAAWGPRHRLAARPRHRPVRAVAAAVLRRAPRPAAWPGTGAHGPPRRRPWGQPWTGPGPQSARALQQAGRLRPRRGQPRAGRLRRRRGWTAHPRPEDCALHSDGPGRWAAVAGFGPAWAALA
jgi:hypothetical protein